MLTQKEMVFCIEYCVDFNGRRAAIAAGYTTNIHSASNQGTLLLKRADIVAEIERRKEIAAAKVNLKVEDIVADIASILRADPRELIEYRRGCCRYCHGDGHLYQSTPQEWRNQYTAHMDSIAGREGTPFDGRGGDQFDPHEAPHPDCPECHGHGVEYVYARDVRHVSSDAAKLYLGTKPTQHGIEILMQSKDAARALAAKYLGMEKLALTIQNVKAKDLTDDQLAAIAARGEFSNE